MVASLVTSSRSRRRRSVTSRTSTSAPMCSPRGPQRDRPHDQRDLPSVADLGVAVGAAAEHRAERLLVGPAARRHQLPGQRRPATSPVEVAGEAEPPVDRQRVGAGVDHPTRGVDPQEAVPDPRGVGVVAALPGLGEVAARRSSGSGRRPSGGRTAPAGSGCARRAGWCCAPPPRSPGRRGGPGSSRPAPGRRRATPGRPRGPAGPRSRPRRASGGVPGARRCPPRRRRTPWGRSWAASARPPRSRCPRGREATAPGRRTTGRR